jgi:transglutaminase-like putative cysteine protease
VQLFPCLLMSLVGGTPAPEYVLVTSNARRIEAVLTYELRYDNVSAAEWIVFGAAAPELPGQAGVKSRFEPEAKLVKDLSPLGRPIFLARVPASKERYARSVPIRITYEAQLRARHLRPRKAEAPAVEGLAPTERSATLYKGGDVDLDAPAFQQWLRANKLARNAAESDVDFGRRVFLALKNQLTYVYTSSLDRRASAVCQAGKSDCGGMATLFVSVLRAQGIPARTLVGRWAQSADPNQKLSGSAYYQWHVKAEFFAQGVGWVPVDLSSAVLHDKSKAGLAYFGHDPGDFFTQHVDTNLEMDTIHFGRQQLHNLQTPAIWVTGSGSVDLRKETEGWQVRALP